MIADINTQRLLLFMVWPLLAGSSLLALWKDRQQSIGLTATYFALFIITHWLQALVYTFPWYVPQHDRETVATGFWVSTIGLMALTSSVVLLRPFHRRHRQRFLPHVTNETKGRSFIDPEGAYEKLNSRLPLLFLVLGLFASIFLGGIDVPTIAAFLSGLSQLFTIGLMLMYWRITQGRANRLTKVSAVLLTLVWPIYVIGAQGFLHFGSLTVMVVLVFALWHYREALGRIVIWAPIVLFVGLSFMVSYFVGRTEIRSIAWNESLPTSIRVQRATDSLLNNLTWFDIYDPQHLEVIDVRLAQNYLIGRVVERFESYQVGPAYGRTLGNAVLMLIPRIIWPDKPVMLGGQAVVNKYSGFSLYAGTVQPGQTMEFYINFRTVGVFLGFIAYGLALIFMDEQAARHLNQQNWSAFGAWVVSGLALLKVEDSMVAVLGAAVSGLISIALFNFGLRVIYYIGYYRAKADSITNIQEI